MKQKSRREIEVVSRQNSVAVAKRIISKAARAALEEWPESAEVSIAVVCDAEMQRLNRRFLEHDWPTDVLAFNLSDCADSLRGEVIVNADCARREADRRGHELEAELTLYVIHGILHLLGYDDGRPWPRRKMKERQLSLLGALGMRLDERCRPASSVGG